jgi:hypothetical protein
VLCWEAPAAVPAHSETAANLLIYMNPNLVHYSEWPLILLRVPPDFDSPMRRFESSRPSQAFRVSENFLLWMRKAR